MSAYDIGPLYKTIEDTRTLIGNLSLTSQFKVSLLLSNSTSGGKDQNLLDWLKRCGLTSLNDLQKYDFMCAEATLPGSTFDMAEESGSRQGIIERFPTRRIYSDFDLTFYVDSNYQLIRLFEEWMNYIDPIHSSDKTYNGSESGQVDYLGSNDFYRFKYPKTYKRTIAITKFERDFIDYNPVTKKKVTKNQPTLTYEFIDAFPTNLTALPLSYEGSTITKTTVNFSYSRYIVLKHKGTNLPNGNASFGDPSQQALQTSNRAGNNPAADFGYTQEESQRGASGFDPSSIDNITRNFGNIQQ